MGANQRKDCWMRFKIQRSSAKSSRMTRRSHANSRAPKPENDSSADAARSCSHSMHGTNSRLITSRSNVGVRATLQVSHEQRFELFPNQRNRATNDSRNTATGTAPRSNRFSIHPHRSNPISRSNDSRRGCHHSRKNAASTIRLFRSCSMERARAHAQANSCAERSLPKSMRVARSRR